MTGCVAMPTAKKIPTMDMHEGLRQMGFRRGVSAGMALGTAALGVLLSSSAGAATKDANEGSEELDASKSALDSQAPRDPLFRADLDISFSYANLEGFRGPQIYGGYLHPRFGLRVWSTPGAAGRVDLGLMAGYRVAPYPDRHADLSKTALQSGVGHRPFVWGSVGHTFYFAPDRKIALGVHGMLGWSNYTLKYSLRDDATGTARILEDANGRNYSSNTVAYALHGHFGVAFGPRAGLLLHGTYTIPTEPVIAPWSVGLGINVKLN